MRRTVSLLLLAGSLVAPASSSAAAFEDATFGNQCQYSYDRYWRPVPIVFGGTLTNGAGAQLASGAQLAVGDSVRLEGGTVSAVLPSWILPFAYESGMVGAGDGELPVRAWLALEATNTTEGVRAPIPLTTTARTHVVLTSSGLVDEERSSIVVVEAPVPTQSWTATGGEVQVRQALGESLPPIPVGRDGANVRVRGSLYVEATLTFPSGDTFRLYLDCLQGEQVNQGADHTDALPGTLGVFGVPGWSGTVDGLALAGPVDADLLPSQGPPRAGQGEQAELRGTSLRLRLTDAQREAWLGGVTSAPITGGVVVHGARSLEGDQTVPVSRTVTVPAAGPAQLSLPLADSTWSAATAEGIDLRGDRVISLDATVGAQTRTLTLTRLSPGDGYPFARVLRPAAPPTPLPTATPAPMASATPAPLPTVLPTVTPVPTRVSRLSVRSTKLKVASRRVTVSLRCDGAAACKGAVRLRTASKVKLGKRAKRIVSLTGSAKYSVAAGKTAALKLSLSKDGRALLKTRKTLPVRLAITPASGSAASKALTLSR